MKNALKKKRVLVLVVAIVVVLLFLLLSLLTASQHIVTLTISEEGSRVFVDQERETITTDENETVTLTVGSGDHTILVSKQGFWPWTESFNTETEDELSFFAFLFEEEPDLDTVTSGSAEYTELAARFSQLERPSVDNKVISDKEDVALWIDEMTIRAERLDDSLRGAFCTSTGVCSDVITVFQGRNEIRTATFYNNRSDTIIFSAEDGIFALELDPTATQNFQPIYTGGLAPIHTLSTDESILYIQDREFIFKKELERQ